MKKPKTELEINTSTDVLKGSYSNAVKVVVTDSEVILDFAFVFPNTDDLTKKSGLMIHRIVMRHDLADKLAESITETMVNHREKANGRSGEDR